MTRRWMIVFALVVGCLAPGTVVAQADEDEQPAEEERPDFDARIRGELGFLDPLWHKVQFGRDNTYFDYVDEGGQDVLFNFQRLSAEFEWGGRHHAILLYQPLRIQSEVVLERDVTVEGTTFNEGTSVDLVYGFPFYRASYLYDLAPAEDREIAVGASLQLRNATIVFSSVDGTQRVANRDVGPVPILKFRGRAPLGGKYWGAAEVDGFYAPIRWLNGDPESDAEGAIVDASLRAGRELGSNLEAFVNLRYLAGGSTGENPDDADEPGGGFTRNWLHFATISLGFSWNAL